MLAANIVIKIVRDSLFQITNRKSAVVLATGDPNFFGIADFIIKKFGKKSVEIIPNASTLQAAFARIKENSKIAKDEVDHVTSYKDMVGSIFAGPGRGYEED